LLEKERQQREAEARMKTFLIQEASKVHLVRDYKQTRIRMELAKTERELQELWNELLELKVSEEDSHKAQEQKVMDITNAELYEPLPNSIDEKCMSITVRMPDLIELIRD
jgi:hypothetical protein